jgi:neutral ceramidase
MRFGGPLPPRAGAASARWDVPIGRLLDGYGARTAPAEGHLDPLIVRALALDDGERRAVVLAAEVIGVDLELTDAIRSDLAADLGLHPDLVMFAATHTHGGPGGVRVGPIPRDDDLRATLRRVAVDAAHRALGSLRPARFAHGRRRVGGLQRHRRDPDATVDDQLDVVLVTGREDRRPLAVVASFACHPTVLDHTNLRYSGDWPGALARTVEASLPGAHALVLTGACADVNPLRVAADAAEVERFGQVLGGAAVRAVGELRDFDADRHVDNLLRDERLVEPGPREGGRVLDLRLGGRREPLRLGLKRFASAAVYTERIGELAAAIEAAAASDAAAASGAEAERRTLVAQRAALRAERSVLAVAEAYRRSGSDIVVTEMQRLDLDAGLSILTFPGEAASTFAARARAAAHARPAGRRVRQRLRRVPDPRRVPGRRGVRGRTHALRRGAGAGGRCLLSSVGAPCAPRHVPKSTEVPPPHPRRRDPSTPAPPESRNPMSSTALHVGFATIDVTPPLGLPMAGYGQRVGVADGVEDPLTVRAVAFRDPRSGGAAALLSTDLVAYAPRTIERFRALLRADTALGIDPDAVIATVTHTHSAPAYHEMFRTYQQDLPAEPEGSVAWGDALPHRMHEAVRAALTGARPATLRVGSVRVDLAVHRRLIDPFGEVRLAPHPEGLHDPEVVVVRADDAVSGERIGTLVNYACHPVVLCEDNLRYSGDYVASLLGALEADGGDAIFFNGACGNVNPGRRGNHAVKRAMGEALAAAVLAADLPAVEADGVQAHARLVGVPLRHQPAEAFGAYVRAAEAALALHGDDGGFEGQRLADEVRRARAMAARVEQRRERFADRVRDGALEVRQQVVRVGPLAFATLPGETFVELGLDLKRRSGIPHLVVVGYADEAIGYVPTSAAYAEGGYEVTSSHVQPGAGERLVDAALESLAAVGARRSGA